MLFLTNHTILYYAIQPPYSKCDPSPTTVTWELVRKVESRVPIVAQC